MNRPYVGRLAPSPTGPLHFGSLLAAVASYCDARAAGGRWLVRMEDIDPPREMLGAAAGILRTLEHYGLLWDGEVRYQSQRSEAYLAAIEQLRRQGEVFWCTCSRSQLARLGNGLYPGTCRAHTAPRPDAAIRLQVEPGLSAWQDRLFGPQSEEVAATVGDFVIQRRDHLFAYQLAVVVDDADQGITDIVRGADLLDNTARQIYLQQRLGVPTPRYAHLPLAVNADGEKLSKQTFAAPLRDERPEPLLWLALQTLGQQPPPELQTAPVAEQLAWAVSRWRLEAIPRQQKLPFDPRFQDFSAL